MPVSSRAVGWLTGALVTLGGTAAVLLWEHPRTTDIRLLIVGGMLLSGVVAGWTARSMFRGAAGPRTWSVAAPCIVSLANHADGKVIIVCVRVEERPERHTMMAQARSAAQRRPRTGGYGSAAR
jgi:hypothetical protein